MGAKNHKKEIDAQLADKNIKFCLSCKHCWAYFLQSTTKNYKNIWVQMFTRYEDFPSYGKEKKKCPSCKGDKTREIVFY